MRLIHGRSDFPFFDGQSMLEDLNQNKLNDANDRHLKYCFISAHISVIVYF